MLYTHSPLQILVYDFKGLSGAGKMIMADISDHPESRKPDLGSDQIDIDEVIQRARELKAFAEEMRFVARATSQHASIEMRWINSRPRSC